MLASIWRSLLMRLRWFLDERNYRVADGAWSACAGWGVSLCCLVLLIVVWCCLWQNSCCDEIRTSLGFRLVVDVIAWEAAKRSSVYLGNWERSISSESTYFWACFDFTEFLDWLLNWPGGFRRRFFNSEVDAFVSHLMFADRWVVRSRWSDLGTMLVEVELLYVVEYGWMMMWYVVVGMFYFVYIWRSKDFDCLWSV
jgi:hypothetical protein